VRVGRNLESRSNRRAFCRRSRQCLRGRAGLGIGCDLGNCRHAGVGVARRRDYRAIRRGRWLGDVSRLRQIPRTRRTRLVLGRRAGRIDGRAVGGPKLAGRVEARFRHRRARPEHRQDNRYFQRLNGCTLPRLLMAAFRSVSISDTTVQGLPARERSPRNTAWLGRLRCVRHPLATRNVPCTDWRSLSECRTATICRPWRFRAMPSIRA
jgi:hypothetical protein